MPGLILVTRDPVVKMRDQVSAFMELSCMLETIGRSIDTCGNFR